MITKRQEVQVLSLSDLLEILVLMQSKTCFSEILLESLTGYANLIEDSQVKSSFRLKALKLKGVYAILIKRISSSSSLCTRAYVRA